jgi:murein DD-endopeptidase MepM/ murein hydrolase activator NlpD
MKIAAIAVACVLVIGFPLLLLALSDTPVVKIDPVVKVIGNDTPVRVHVEDPHGVRSVTAFVEQNGQRHTVYEKSEPASRLFFFRKHVAPRDFTFSAGKKQAQALQDGKARLVVEAVSNDLRGSSSEATNDIEVNTHPLTIAADGFQHYINQGGSELVTFTVSGYWTEAGVRAGKYTFRSFPMPGKSENERFSLFAFPWDLPADTIPVVYARNPAGAEVTARFWYKLFPKSFRKRDLDITDDFLQRVDNQIDHGAPGDLLQRFLRINGEMRKQNNQTLADLRLKTADRFLWSGPFQQLGNSKVESQFADERSYIYKGKKVDQQMHLGFDLSVVKNVPVVASNSGKILYGSDLGIYGNCIVIDHGYGLQSIYGHLSQIDVKVGDDVKKAQSMGKSGATGLAGGDHLHYSMQVDGVQVNPVEWWDEHWIKDRILSKIQSQ